MVQFAPGETKTAHVPIILNPAGLSCHSEVWLGPNENNKVASSGLIAFTSQGSERIVSHPVIMPDALGTYHVYIDIYVEDAFFLGYISTEDVEITEGAAGAFDMFVSSAIPGSVHLGTIPFYEVRYSIHNPYSVPVTHQLTQKWQWDSSLPDPNNPAGYTQTRWWRMDPEPVWYVYTIEVKLSPGETMELIGPREQEIPGYPGQWQANVPSATGGLPWFMLFDELGNHSLPLSG
jgi:hypothetical protein